MDASKLPAESPKQLFWTMFEEVTVKGGQVFEQAGKEARLAICKLSPAASINRIGYVPEGVIVVPVVKLVQEVTLTAQPGGKAQPKLQALQSCVVPWLYHV